MSAMTRTGPEAGHGPAEVAKSAVEFKDVTTVLDDVPVLHRFGLRLEPGTVTVLLGATGTGKTTVVRHLAGLLPADRGTITVDGQRVDVSDQEGLRRIRRGMSVLFGGASMFESTLFGSLSARANIAVALTCRGVDPDQADRIAECWLQRMSLHDRSDALPSEMPAHARKRLAIARALAIESPVLVLDEMEAGLDAAHAAAVVAAIRARHERLRPTVLLTTYDIALARAVADTVAILRLGRVAATGPPEELLRDTDDIDDLARRLEPIGVLGSPDLESVRAELDGDGPKPGWRVEIDQRTVMLILLVVALSTWGAAMLLLLTR